VNHYGRISYTEAQYMPVALRKWWINRIDKAREEEVKAKGGGDEAHVDPHGRVHNG